MTNEIIVGNVGTVYRGEDFREAWKTYTAYLLKSKQGVGRAANESVVWIRDGDVFQEHTPKPPPEDTHRCTSCGRLMFGYLCRDCDNDDDYQ